MPTKCRPCSFSACSRRRVSVKWALPPSTTMSPSSSSGTSSSITASVGSPALTMITIARGCSMLATKSSSDSDADEVALVAELVHQRGHLGGGAVVHRDGVPVAGDVAGQVAPHHRESGQPDRCSCVHASTQLGGPTAHQSWDPSEDVERAELHRHPRPGVRDLGDGVLPRALAGAAHDQQVAVAHLEGDRGPPRRGRSTSLRGSPSDTIATIVSWVFPRPMVSPCQATLSRPSR